MDSLTDKEFHELFDRISARIDLKDCSTPDDVKEKIQNRIKHLKEIRKKELKKEKPAYGLKMAIVQLKRLAHSGFGVRVIDEAVARPQGIIAQTLIHGRTKAREILLKRASARRGVTYRRIRNRRRLGEFR